MTAADAHMRAIECLKERGADRVAHPGGTLLEHLSRTAARLLSWGAAPELVIAGACHAAYGTAGFPTALVAISERSWLRARIGDHAEGIVYEYCARDRERAPSSAQRDRFTHASQLCSVRMQRALAELTAANELDVAEHAGSAATKRAIGAELTSLACWLSPAARAAVQHAPCLLGHELEPMADGGDGDIAYRELGEQGPTLVLLHGGAPPELTWSRQHELARTLALRIPWRRDYAPSAPADRLDFEVDARDLLRIMPGKCHVVAHSIGALSALVAAAAAPDRFASLVLIEPPVSWLLPDDPEVQRVVALARAFLRGDPSARNAFLSMASMPLEHPETARIERVVHKLRDPSEAAPSLEALSRAHVPAVVVSGQHEPGIERSCDALAARLGAARWRLPGAGHAVQRHPDFNRRLLELLAPFFAR